MDPIRIDNLTPYQVELLDAMWTCNTMEEYLDWYNLLDAEDQDMADILQHVVILESMEEMLAEVSNGFQDARDYLKKFML
jgi:hypothetical protein